MRRSARPQFEPVGVLDRAFYAQRREQLKQAAIEAKDGPASAEGGREEVNRDRERGSRRA